MVESEVVGISVEAKFIVKVVESFSVDIVGRFVVEPV